MKIYLATGNLDKKREIQQIFPEHTIVIPKDEGIAFDPEETGTTFYENSLIKAKALYDIVSCPVIADDSGICADALMGAPGIYSSRYAGPDFMQGTPDGKKIPQAEQNRMLLEQVTESVNKLDPKVAESFPNGPRSCKYVCSMVLYLGRDRLYVCQETMEGSLLEDISQARGNGGFGYDPIVYLPGYDKTVAELSAEEKNKISHRGKASRILKRIVESLVDF